MEAASQQLDRSSQMRTGTIFDIKRYAIHDGPGIRVTVFLKGCPLKCLWCHNPEGQAPNPEPMSRGSRSRKAATNGDERCGRVVAVEDVLEEIEKETLFLDESGGGVTFSGGEPLMQPQFLGSLLEACKAREIHTAVDTCGYAPVEVLDSVLDKVDLFLFDLKLMDDALHREYTGMSNRPIIRNLRRLHERGVEVVLRIPLIPGITDTEKNISDMAEFLSSLSRIRNVALLPFHKTATGKYRRLDREDGTGDLESLSPDGIEAIKARFEGQGARVTIGG